MYENLSKKITNILIEKNVIIKSDFDVYVYCFQIILSTIISSIFITIWAIVFKQIFNTFIFFIGFFLCRKICGGYHAKSQVACFLLTQILFISFLSLISFSNILESITMFVLISAISTTIIIIFAPIDNENKPFNQTEYLKFKRKSRILSSINIIIVFVSSCFSLFFDECFCYMLGVFFVSIMLIFGKIQNILTSKQQIKRKEYNIYEKS